MVVEPFGMNRLALPSALLAATLVSGCGGGGGGSSHSGPQNPFTGFYKDPGTASNTADVVFANIGVGSDGTLCGAIYDRKTKTKVTLGALVSDTGAVTNGSVEYYDSTGKALESGLLSGQITIVAAGTNGPGSVRLNLTATTATETVTYAFSTLNNVTTALAAARWRRHHKI
jgi:hypothetical protein